MQFVWLGFLNSADAIEPAMQQQISEFLQQPYVPITAAGLLRDGEGARSGYLMIFEADSREAAEALVRESPLRLAGLYREFHLFDYHNEVG